MFVDNFTVVGITTSLLIFVGVAYLYVKQR